MLSLLLSLLQFRLFLFQLFSELLRCSQLFLQFLSVLVYSYLFIFERLLDLVDLVPSLFQFFSLFIQSLAFSKGLLPLLLHGISDFGKPLLPLLLHRVLGLGKSPLPLLFHRFSGLGYPLLSLVLLGSVLHPQLCESLVLPCLRVLLQSGQIRFRLSLYLIHLQASVLGILQGGIQFSAESLRLFSCLSCFAAILLKFFLYSVPETSQLFQFSPESVVLVAGSFEPAGIHCLLLIHLSRNRLLISALIHWLINGRCLSWCSVILSGLITWDLSLITLVHGHGASVSVCSRTGILRSVRNIRDRSRRLVHLRIITAHTALIHVLLRVLLGNRFTLLIHVRIVPRIPVLAGRRILLLERLKIIIELRIHLV